MAEPSIDPLIAEAPDCGNRKCCNAASAGLHSLFASILSVLAYIASMNSKQKKALAAIFTDPVSGTIAWADIESLLRAVGCTVIEGNGSRVRFTLNGHVASFHRPHPEKEARRYQVRDAREFLALIGVTP
jgi:hypothetical protein